MLNPYTVLLAALLDGSALWRALVDHTVPVHVALLRLLVALPVAVLATVLVRAVVGSYAETQRRDLAAEHPAVGPGVHGPARRRPAGGGTMSRQGPLVQCVGLGQD